MTWRGELEVKLNRGEWTRYAMAVIGANAGLVVWLSSGPYSEDPLLDGLIGAAIIAGFLSIVMGVGATMFGSAKNRAALDEIKAGLKDVIEGQKVIIDGQKDIIRLLKELIDRFDAHFGRPNTPPPPSGGEDGGRSAGS